MTTWLLTRQRTLRTAKRFNTVTSPAIHRLPRIGKWRNDGTSWFTKWHVHDQPSGNELIRPESELAPASVTIGYTPQWARSRRRYNTNYPPSLVKTSTILLDPDHDTCMSKNKGCFSDDWSNHTFFCSFLLVGTKESIQ